MIFHVSIAADDPVRVGDAIARLWRAEAMPFPPIGAGSVIVLAGDHRNSAIEIYPRGTELHPAEGDADAEGRTGAPVRHGSVHMAIATPLAADEVFALAADYGWLAKARRRGGMFGVIELWVENALMVEVLTAEMQAEYLETMTPDGWRASLAAGPPLAA
ncbi:hypothetical protein [Phenylobacterium kunshanense]|uniref:VOC family protein n=1 Tax=Phenylobacterium kunshanense TaxID=1445034 RepID=A0A328BMT9_9CAUL|nr:hypothetical protein [Phenylobacterium kunshanense]RAK67879.1 hypothetical protein DJ019_05665 [Phenylobacterium kunshanense]